MTFRSLVFCALLSTSVVAQQVLKEDPPRGALASGAKVLVDDGTCPAGEIKELTGGPPRTSRCIVRKPQEAKNASLTPSEVKAAIGKITSDHHLKSVWFRVEQPGVEPIDVSVNVPQRAVGIGSISKSITAIGIAILIQEGKLRLDSKLGDVLRDYFANRHVTLDPSLEPITIERLLTHRAGLMPNRAADEEHGLRSVSVTDRIGGKPHFFNYIITAHAAKSSGKDDYVYSNLSYLVLGMVIEAVSGEEYAHFCQKRIFEPLDVKGARIPTYWNVVAPFGGWQIPLADLFKVWSVFDIERPTLLSAATLQTTLLGRLGRPIRENSNVYYTLGVWVRQNSEGGPYVLTHDGYAGFIRGVPTYQSYIEKFVPGHAWAIAVSPAPPERDARKIRLSVVKEVRLMIQRGSHEGAE